MTIDNLTWHANSAEYPPDVPRENGCTHIGIFLAWAIINNLESEQFANNHSDLIDKIRNEEITGREFLLKACNAEIREDYFNEECKQFIKNYYSTNKYISDYAKLLGRANISTVYHVVDSWKSYHFISQKIDQRYADWKSGKKWWEFWK